MSGAGEAGAAPKVAVRIAALSGSMRSGSNTRKALEVALQGVKKLGAEITVLDLAELKLPPFDGDAALKDPRTLQFKEAIRAADGLIVATPVYHDSFAGMVKNAFDLLYDELLEKVAALVAVGGGRVGHGQALEHLRAVLRETGTWVIPRQVVIGSADKAFDAEGNPHEKEVETRLVALGQELVLRCLTLRPKRRT